MDQDLDKKEEKEKQAKIKAQIALLHYNEEKEHLKKQAYTSFGKMVLAEEVTKPKYSIGKETKFLAAGQLITVPRDTPGPIYSPADEQYYKYHYAPKWRIGNGLRPPLYQGERFEHFNHPYEEDTDLSKLDKKWRKPRGGAMPLEERIKYNFREGVPGPGRYEPSMTLTKYKTPTYYIGEKVNSLSLRLLTGTNNTIGPGKYNVEQSKYTSEYTDPPQWSVGKAKRKGLYNQKWTKDETYYLYSSVGDQIMTQKKTEPQVNLGKSTRAGEKKRGMFSQMMDQQPTKIRIEIPKF